MNLIAYFDIEANQSTGRILDIGCVFSDDSVFHKNQPYEFKEFIEKADFICGHNIIAHDLAYLQKYFNLPEWGLDKAIDTLLFSPLLFPKNPYHRLLKDDKIQTEELNNPVNDSYKAKNLFLDEIDAFQSLDEGFKQVLYLLLSGNKKYINFFKYLKYSPTENTGNVRLLIKERFKGNICENCDFDSMISSSPVALAYTLALLNANDRHSITPPWILKNYPEVEKLTYLLRNQPCDPDCDYCREALDPVKALKKYFGHSAYRKYGDEPLQENAVKSAILGESLLAIFPTGGGKSITFQVPALMSGENAKALTVVISPLQSLMKDQVDKLEEGSITDAVTINGLLDPIERSKAIERIEDGSACLLYISPESLRSVTIERLLLKRKIARFVIDEAHCLSSWGQDFRVDYLYIGEFIKTLQENKKLDYSIPVSCFTATAKQKVIEDIVSYFKKSLNLDIRVFSANATRTNLHYKVYRKESEEDKYSQLREIIVAKPCPTIVYVSRTKRAYQIADRLNEDGFNAKTYHGKMEKKEKSENQDAFKAGKVDIMVATSAFGMGVDKNDVGAVIHYDISDSLENYVQEAGRAGRNENISADCYVLFNEDDLDKHFILLNQTKISSKEINQIWKAIKELTKTRERASSSALEIARKAGWDDTIQEIETRVKTAIAALEDAGYLKRGQNNPNVYANSILSKNAQEAIEKIKASAIIPLDLKEKAIRIIKKLFSSKSKRLSTDEVAESRVDYISDQLGIVKEVVIRVIELLREEGILAQAKDLTAFIKKSETANKSLNILENFRRLEKLLLDRLSETESDYNLKEIVTQFLESGVKDAGINKLKTLLNFWTIKNWIKPHYHEYSKNHVRIQLLSKKDQFREQQEKRHIIARSISEYLFKKVQETRNTDSNKEEILVEFSILELKALMDEKQGLFSVKASIDDIEDSLFYLARIEAIKVEGGFLVVHNKLTIDRIERSNKVHYKDRDYEKLKNFYQQKVQQIHIVGEYAKKMINNYNEALQFADDYFKLNYSVFLSKYFPGSRLTEIKQTLTPEKFKRIFGSLSANQLKIINDADSQFIVVAAGPGSGKTRVLVHKLASLILAEDVKHEQLLMLTFSRAAATEFKKRLLEIMGNAANFIAIKTFHSYCFDLLGIMGSVTDSNEVISTTVEKIRSGEIEVSKITKAVLVVDEAQDMSANEYALVKELMEQNPEMRVILVGDDDQNIYGFRQSDSAYMGSLITEQDAKLYELTENYRSKNNLVAFANNWAATISKRMKSDLCYAKDRTDGEIQITEYHDSNLITPLADTLRQIVLKGTTAILTKTNDEALLLTGVLLQHGLKARLIQSNDGFRLNNLLELRNFTDLLNQNVDSPIVNEKDWILAKQHLESVYKDSNNLELVSTIISEFEAANPARRYKSDWENYLSESQIENFTKIRDGVVYVSTIHKSKGKEFDHVFLLLNSFLLDNDEKRRQIYVAITRAKSHLNIHYNGMYFKNTLVESVRYFEDNKNYEEPHVISIDLTHRDVQLGYFEYVQRRLMKLNAGAKLGIADEGLCNANGELVLKYSRKFKETLQGWFNKNYKIFDANINLIVFWKDEKKEEEVKIILPHLVLKNI